MPGGGGGGSFKASGFLQWNLPFSAPSAAVWIAMFAQAHFHRYGTTREQMAWIALNARRNAQLNPNAIYRDADVARRLLRRRASSRRRSRSTTATCRATAPRR